jgi:hypothetical protein
MSIIHVCERFLVSHIHTHTHTYSHTHTQIHTHTHTYTGARKVGYKNEKMKAKHALNPVDTSNFELHYPCTTLYSAELVFMVSGCLV